MLTLSNIVASAADDQTHRTLHDLDSRDCLERVEISQTDMARRRLRVQTDKGTDLAIALPRTTRLYDGAVLVLKPDQAIVVCAAPEDWLRLRPKDTASALHLAYRAGNLHWRVRFDGAELLVGVDQDVDALTARLQDLISQEVVELVSMPMGSEV